MAATGDLVTAVTTSWDTQNTFGTTTSTSYTATLTGGTACGLAFVAPASGKVLIHNVCDIKNSGAGYCSCAIELRTGGTIGSGTVVTSPGFDNNILQTGTAQVRCMVTEPVSGLTAGATYNVRQLYLVQSGTGTFSNKKLIVEGVI